MQIVIFLIADLSMSESRKSVYISTCLLQAESNLHNFKYMTSLDL